MDRTSVDTSRSSIDNSKRSTKRNALREFYKLQPPNSDADSSLIASSVISSARTSLSDVTSTGGTGEYDWEAEEQRLEAKLEAGSFDAEEIARDILTASGSGSRVLKDLLKKENSLLQSIRMLQSEQKALVYNNYSRLIAVSETLAKMKSGSQDDSDKGAIKIRIGDEENTTPSIDLTREKLPGLIRDITTASRNLKLDVTSSSNESSTLNSQQVAQWLLNTPDEVRKMEQGEARQNRIEESLKVLDLWMEKSKVKELENLKQSIQGLL